nr:extracellular solute-binding protein [Marinitoga lauensis]
MDFYSTVLKGIYDGAKENKAETTLMTFEDFKNKRKKCDGILIIGSDPIPKEFLNCEIPTVLVDNYIVGEKINAVISNGFDGAYYVINKMIKRNYKRIIHIHGSLEFYGFRRRFEGYELAMKNNNLLPMTYEVAENQESINYIIDLVLDKKPEVIFASNDPIAIMVLNILKKKKINVPKDVQIIGFDDIVFASSTQPALSTIKVFKYEMGNVAIERVIELSNGKNLHPYVTSLFTEFIERKTTKGYRKMKKFFILAFVFLLIISVFAKTKIVFWTAPNPNQEAYWKKLVAEYEKLNPDIDIEWTTIPAAGSSEEAILSAIASGRTPDICTNIFSGFAAQLIELDQLVELNKLPGFNDLIASRKMESIIKGWNFMGKTYVLPIYSNPILMWWRKDILEKYGWEKPPRTYSEIYELSKQFVIPNKKYTMRVVAGRNWWDRWFDYITYYYAASEGKPYIDLKKYRAIYNNDAGIKVAKFFETMFKNKWTAVDLGNAPLYNGVILGSLKGPWEIPYAEKQFPEVLKI